MEHIENKYYSDCEKVKPYAQEIVQIITKEKLSYYQAIQTLHIAQDLLNTTTFPTLKTD